MLFTQKSTPAPVGVLGADAVGLRRVRRLRQAPKAAAETPQGATRKRRRRRLLETTVTLDRPMAAAAKIGFSRMPNGG